MNTFQNIFDLILITLMFFVLKIKIFFFDYFCLDCHKEICNKCINEGNKHLNHKIITKNEYDKMKNENKNSCLGFNNYSEIEIFLNKIEIDC